MIRLNFKNYTVQTKIYSLGSSKVSCTSIKPWTNLAWVASIIIALAASLSRIVASSHAVTTSVVWWNLLTGFVTRCKSTVEKLLLFILFMPLTSLSLLWSCSFNQTSFSLIIGHFISFLLDRSILFFSWWWCTSIFWLLCLLFRSFLDLFFGWFWLCRSFHLSFLGLNILRNIFLAFASLRLSSSTRFPLIVFDSFFSLGCLFGFWSLLFCFSRLFWFLLKFGFRRISFRSCCRPKTFWLRFLISDWLSIKRTLWQSNLNTSAFTPSSLLFVRNKITYLVEFPHTVTQNSCYGKNFAHSITITLKDHSFATFNFLH